MFTAPSTSWYIKSTAKLYLLCCFLVFFNSSLKYTKYRWQNQNKPTWASVRFNKGTESVWNNVLILTRFRKSRNIWFVSARFLVVHRFQVNLSSFLTTVNVCPPISFPLKDFPSFFQLKYLSIKECFFLKKSLFNFITETLSFSQEN